MMGARTRGDPRVEVDFADRAVVAVACPPPRVPHAQEAVIARGDEYMLDGIKVEGRDLA